jgi:hypothetical protein
MDQRVTRAFPKDCREIIAMNERSTASDIPLGKWNLTRQLSSLVGNGTRPIEWLGFTLLVFSFIGWPATAQCQDLQQPPGNPPQPRRVIDEVIAGEGAEKGLEKEAEAETDTDTVEEEAEPANDAPPADHPALPALMQQLESQYESMLQTELHLAFLVGQFPKAQREAIGGEVRNGFRALVRKLAEDRLPKPANVQRGRGVGGVIGIAGQPARAVQRVVVNGVAQNVVLGPDNVWQAVPASQSDIPSQIEQLISDAMAEHASPETVEQFKQEREKRTARLKQVIISSIVTGLDEKLLLSPSQREEVTSLIDKHWNSPNPQLLDQFTYPNDNGWLPIADNLVMSILTPSQRRVWMDRRGQHTVVFNAVGGVGRQNFRIDDAMWKGFDRDESEEAR